MLGSPVPVCSLVSVCSSVRVPPFAPIPPQLPLSPPPRHPGSPWPGGHRTLGTGHRIQRILLLLIWPEKVGSFAHRIKRLLCAFTSSQFLTFHITVYVCTVQPEEGRGHLGNKAGGRK